MSLCGQVSLTRHTSGAVSERRLSDNFEYVNPEMRETLGFPFQHGRFVKPGKAGQVKPVSEREITYTQSQLPR